MKIKCLGSGSAFTLENYQTSFLIDTGEESLLFDCGGDIRFALKDYKSKFKGKIFSYKDIKNVYISHLHGDHIGGLEWLGFSKYFDPSEEKPNLFISEILVDDLWNRCLSGGMGSVQGKVVGLDDFFNICSIKNNGVFKIDKSDTYFQLVQTIHIMNGYYFVPSFGLMVTVGRYTKSPSKIFFTGDTQFSPDQIKTFYNQADLIFHDCEYLYERNGTPIMSGVHAHYEKLKSLPEQVKNKMYLVHFQDKVLTNSEICSKYGFKGFLRKGEEIEV